MTLAQSASSGSESMAWSEGMCMNVGYPPWFSRMRVPSYKRKSEEDGMTVEGVGGAIVPTNRVTTGEGRAPGQDCPWKGNGER